MNAPLAELTVALPMTIDELDAAWFTEAIRTRHPGITVTGARVVDVNNGTNTKVRVALEVDEVGRAAGIPATVIVKAGFEPHSRVMAQILRKEVDFYTHVGPVLGMQTPQCYFAGYDHDLLQGVMILEDLVARGVDFLDARRPSTYDQVERRLASLAAYHARTWGSAELRPGGTFGWLPGPGGSLGFWDTRFTDQVWGRFRELPRAHATSSEFHDLDWAREAYTTTVRASEGLPSCILHGDTHLGNLYIDPDGTPGYYDSMVSQGPAMYDVTYHLTCAVDLAHRREWERPLVAHYLAELGRHGVADAPDLDAAMHQFGLFLVRGYVIFFVNENTWQPEAVNTAYTARFGQAMLDHGTKQLLAAI